MIRLANHGPAARVHLLASRFAPAFSAREAFGRLSYPEPRAISVSRGTSAYISGRDIGDEYRYILDRKYASKYAGNMLTRPGLLLNPWAVRSTETDVAEVAEASELGAAGAGPMRLEEAARAPQPGAAHEQGSHGSGTLGTVKNKQDRKVQEFRDLCSAGTAVSINTVVETAVALHNSNI